MSLYAVAEGFNIALIDLELLEPQPKCDGVQGSEVLGLDAAQTRNFLFAELEWTGITDTQYLAIMSQLGITSTVRSNEITVYLRDEDNVYKRYNGVAQYPTTKRNFKREFRHRKDVSIKILKLIEIP